MLLLGLMLSATGCTSYEQHVRLMREQFYASNISGARETIAKVQKRHRKEADVLALEQAVIALARRRAERSRKSPIGLGPRPFPDYLEQQAAGEMALSMITDDNGRSYAGEDYEKVLIRAFLAISNLMTDGGDAGAYALQVADKQQQIIESGVDKAGENPKLAYQRLAVGAYIHGLLREQTHMNYDDAARDSAIVCSWQPNFPFGQQDLERATHGHHTAAPGQRRALRLCPGGPRAVQGAKRRNADDRCPAGRRSHPERDEQIHAAADHRAGQGAQSDCARLRRAQRSRQRRSPDGGRHGHDQ